jgi:hypothetical protein
MMVSRAALGTASLAWVAYLTSLPLHAFTFSNGDVRWSYSGWAALRDGWQPFAFLTLGRSQVPILHGFFLVRFAALWVGLLWLTNLVVLVSPLLVLRLRKEKRALMAGALWVIVAMNATVWFGPESVGAGYYSWLGSFLLLAVAFHQSRDVQPAIRGKVYLAPYRFFVTDALTGREREEPLLEFRYSSFGIPAAYRIAELFEASADKREHADTIVEIEWHLVRVGHYTRSGQTATRVDCDVRVIKASTHRTVKRKTFTGPAPPPRIIAGGSHKVATPFDHRVLRDYLWKCCGKPVSPLTRKI